MDVYIATQFEAIEIMKGTTKAQNETIELYKKERNPNRVTGGKRGRPKGSKSKAVSFAADAMPAVMTWCLSVREQKWQQHWCNMNPQLVSALPAFFC